MEYGFDILKKMWRGTNKWAFVIDVRNSVVYFNTSRSRGMKYFSIKDFDFSPETPVKMFDMNENTSGDISKQFTLYLPQLIRYSIIECNKCSNPYYYNDKTKPYIDPIIKRIEKLLAGIEANKIYGEDLSKDSFLIKRIDALKVVSIRDYLSSSGQQEKLWNELTEFLIKNKIRTNGPGFTVYHGNNGLNLDIEVAIPVFEMASGSERVRFKTLEGMNEMASVIYKGSYQGLQSAYDDLSSRLSRDGYRIAGPLREIWLRSDSEEKDLNEFLTEIQIPVKKK